MLMIDGSFGEGGGQILRSALGLAMVTGQAIRVEKIRAGREKPGLMRQHLTAVEAAAAVSGAKVRGDEIASQELTFEPGPIRPGQYSFAVGTAGSATLVLQTVLPALMIGRDASELTLSGGTHNPWSPPFDFLQKSFLPLLGRIGPRVKAELKRPGFYPAGGGEFTVLIQPVEHLKPLELLDRGEINKRKATAMVARLPETIAERELKVVREELGWPEEYLMVEKVENSLGPGNVLCIELESEHVMEVFTGFGQLHVSAETVARKVLQQVREYLAAGVPVGEHLADQLLVPLALAGGRFRTVEPSRHTQTNIELIKKFLEVEVIVTMVEPKVWEIEIRK
jgi:RNA 3'-terminal phosphate cyclase (ATP)